MNISKITIKQHVKLSRKINSLQFMILNHKSAQSFTFNKNFLSILTAISYINVHTKIEKFSCF